MPRRRMANRKVIYIPTGGTIGMRKRGGALSVDNIVQDEILEIMQRVPFTEFIPVDVGISGDSSRHARDRWLHLMRAAIDYSSQGDGVVVPYGSDTSDPVTETGAVMGNELVKNSIVVTASQKDLRAAGSDAPKNAIAGAFYAAYGDTSGLFQVRPNGYIITNRIDTPAGSADWHQRHQHDTVVGYYARVNLERLIEEDCNILPELLEELTRLNETKRLQPLDKLLSLIDYQRLYDEDNYLDFADYVSVGGRGRLPPICVGFTRGTLRTFRSDIAQYGDFEGNPAAHIARTIQKLVLHMTHDSTERMGDPSGSLRNIWGTRFVGQVIPYFSLAEIVKRTRTKKTSPQDHWKDTLEILLRDALGMDEDIAREIGEFWERKSYILNDGMDFKGIMSPDGSASDPSILLQEAQLLPVKAYIIRGTGSAGLRLDSPDETWDTYLPFLQYCRDSGIPVVLTAEGKGEVTSLTYGPANEMFDQELIFFAGTLESKMMQVRVALINSEPNSGFIDRLIGTLDRESDIIQEEIRRDIHRQLLTGTHYRNRDPRDKYTDRQRMEQRFGVETRIDLLQSMHFKKGALAAFVNTAYRMDISLNDKIIDVLKAA